MIGKLLTCCTRVLTVFLDLDNAMAVIVPKTTEQIVAITAILTDTKIAFNSCVLLNNCTYQRPEKPPKCDKDLALLNEKTAIINIGK